MTHTRRLRRYAASLLLLAGAANSAASAQQPDPGVLCGIDVLVRDGFRQLDGRRVGLITNHTGLDRFGRTTIELLHEASEVELVALFHFFDERLSVRVILKVSRATRAGGQCPQQAREQCT